jgi:HSP20 family protein
MARRRDAERLSDEIDDLFADLWRVPRFSGLRRAFRPDADCFRTNEPPALTVVVELAGVDPADLRIDASATRLVVHGERRRPAAVGRVYQQMEIEYGAFRREIALAEPVDVESATATYDRGLLTVVLPLAQRPPHRLAVPVTIRAGG